MQMNAYLSFSGECEAAFKFYEECLDGKLGEVRHLLTSAWSRRADRPVRSCWNGARLKRKRSHGLQEWSFIGHIRSPETVGRQVRR